GIEYSGKLSSTVSGLTCQRWDSQQPHIHFHTADYFYPELDVSAAHNFCRNPSNDRNGPWCYTTDPDINREYCDVPFCA
ncbi:hypothetical protein CAPTEDRAFT_59638, partial [Capitella teleta]